VERGAPWHAGRRRGVAVAVAAFGYLTGQAGSRRTLGNGWSACGPAGGAVPDGRVLIELRIGVAVLRQAARPDLPGVHGRSATPTTARWPTG
jgi:hypothetical protein